MKKEIYKSNCEINFEMHKKLEGIIYKKDGRIYPEKIRKKPGEQCVAWPILPQIPLLTF